MNVHIGINSDGDPLDRPQDELSWMGNFISISVVLPLLFIAILFLSLVAVLRGEAPLWSRENDNVLDDDF